MESNAPKGIFDIAPAIDELDDLPHVDTMELPEISSCDTSENESADGDVRG